MFRIYLEGDYRINIGESTIEFMDSIAKDLFNEGLKVFRDLQLNKNYIINHGNHVYIIPWMGDKIINTLTILLIKLGYKASCFAGIIEVDNSKVSDISKSLQEICYMNKPKNAELAEFIENKQTEKYDYLLPKSLLNEGYGAKAFDIDGTIKWLMKVN